MYYPNLFKKVESVHDFNRLMDSGDNFTSPEKDFIAFDSTIPFGTPLYVVSIVYDIDDYVIVAEPVSFDSRSNFIPHKLKLFSNHDDNQYFILHNQRHYLSDFISFNSAWATSPPTHA